MTDYVKVMRVATDNAGTLMNGWFYSKIFAIDVEKNLFLVYDDGTRSAYDYVPGFIWVDIKKRYYDIGCNEEDLSLPVVTLCTESEIEAELKLWEE